MVFVWLGLGVLLLWVELHHLGFYALFAAAGSLAAAAVAVPAPSALAPQGAVFVGVTVLGVIAVRPMVSRVFLHRRDMAHVARGVHGGLVGQEVVTIDEVGGRHDRGHVRLAGEVWLAAADDGTIGSGQTVIVRAVEGTTLVVEAVPVRRRR